MAHLSARMQKKWPNFKEKEFYGNYHCPDIFFSTKEK